MQQFGAFSDMLTSTSLHENYLFIVFCPCMALACIELVPIITIWPMVRPSAVLTSSCLQRMHLAPNLAEVYLSNHLLEPLSAMLSDIT